MRCSLRPTRAVPGLLLYGLLFLPDFSEFAGLFNAQTDVYFVSATDALWETLTIYLPLTALIFCPAVRAFVGLRAVPLPPASKPPAVLPAGGLLLVADTFFTLLGLFAISLAASNLDAALQPEGGGAPLAAEPGALAAVCLMLAAGACAEEAFFRYFLPASFYVAGCGLIPASVLAALLFTLPHVWEGAAGLLNALCAGFFLSAIYVQRRRHGCPLLPLMAAHALYNIAALLGML